MSVLAECPICHKKQSLRNKLCSCGQDLVKLKRSNKVKYWIIYRLPGGQQKKEMVGTSVEEARDADGKRRVQKRENRIFDIKPESKMTFQEMTKWYLDLEKVKSLSYYPTLTFCLDRFNEEFGNMVVSQIRPIDLENYQAKRKNEGRADSTIDHQIASARTMVMKAFDNDMVGGDTLRVFKRVKKMLRRNANARKNILSSGQFKVLLEHLPPHSKAILAAGFFTGMRKGEILNLTRDKVFFKDRIIKLEATDTKDKEPRVIPICDELHEILKALPTAIHDDHVFLYKGRPIKDIRTTLANACEKSGIPYGRTDKDGFVFHDLRHTFNTYMRKAGVQESVIMDITGHSTREMFDRYNTVDIDDAQDAMKKFEGFLANVTQNVTQTAVAGV